MHTLRVLTVCAALTATSALAGEKWIRNDTFTGSGSVSTAVHFGSGEGCGVLLTPDAADYPLKLVAVDILAAPIVNGGTGAVGAYVIDVWDETSGPLNPPTTANGNLYSGGVALTASTTQFNRFTFPSPITVTSGKLFIGLKTQTSSADDGTTIGLDSGPVVPGATWFRVFGVWKEMTGMGSGATGVNRNWIIRAVLSLPDVPPTVTSIDPPSGASSENVPVTITGTNFTIDSKVFLGTTELTVNSRVPPTQLFATVPSGFPPGVYDVTVRNPGPLEGKLTAAYTVTGMGTDAGMTTDAGTTDAGVDPTPDAGTTGDGGSVPTDRLALESVDPTEAWSADETTLLLVGRNFDEDAQVLLGKKLVSNATRKSGSIIEAVLEPGTPPGEYDITVINSDGERATLEKALTMHDGASVKTGCGCGTVPPVALLAWLAVAGAALRAGRQRAVRREE